jgi:putative oxidoreductase
MNKHQIGHTLMRVTLGALFLVMGINKFQDPEGIIGMLGGIGFPAAAFFGWLLLLSEIIFGAAILVGYKVRYTAWPLAIILAVALVTVTIPSPDQGIMSANFYFHIISIAALVSIAFTGPGEWTISKK